MGLKTSTRKLGCLEKIAHFAIRWAGFLRFLRPRGGGVRGGGSTKMNGGTLMRQGPHKAVGYVCLEKNLAGVPGLGWHGDSWGLVWPHSSHMGGMVGMESRRLGRAWDKYSESLPVF